MSKLCLRGAIYPLQCRCLNTLYQILEYLKDEAFISSIHRRLDMHISSSEAGTIHQFLTYPKVSLTRASLLGASELTTKTYTLVYTYSQSSLIWGTTCTLNFLYEYGTGYCELTRQAPAPKKIRDKTWSYIPAFGSQQQRCWFQSWNCIFKVCLTIKDLENVFANQPIFSKQLNYRGTAIVLWSISIYDLAVCEDAW